MIRRPLLLILSLLFAVSSLSTFGDVWTPQSPGAIRNGGVEGITNNEVIGAINVVVADPSNAGTLWVGTVNGGIWKTTNATASSPSWTPETDTNSSLSISALVLDPILTNTLVAGTGALSNYLSIGGIEGKLFRTTNGGTAWIELAATGLPGTGISGLVARNNVIVASSAGTTGRSTTCAAGGIFRSTDTGSNFSAIVSHGLPSSYAVWHLVASSPSDNSYLYAAVHDCTNNANGIYRSTDLGENWAPVNGSAMSTDLAAASSAKIAVGASGEIYFGIVVGGRLSSLYRSGDHGLNWVVLDKPTTTESGAAGIQGIHPGAQGDRNFSIVADPLNSNIVYVGGDRQAGYGDGTGLPNSIGAVVFDGRLFRVDASAPSGSQATPLTHCPGVSAGCSTQSTDSNSAPHADSRSMAFDANNDLLETDDGGIYRRTKPRGGTQQTGYGDWFSVIGNLQITEVHDVAYDHIPKKIIAGVQDCGTPEQLPVQNGVTNWSDVDGADGGDVAVDDASYGTASPPQSIRYSSRQALGYFVRRVMDGSGNQVSLTEPSGVRDFWYVIPPATAPSKPYAQFLTPVKVNRVDPARLLFACTGDLYESLNKGDSVNALGSGNGTGPTTVAMVYGGRSGGIDNADLIWSVAANNVYVRTAGAGEPLLVQGIAGPAIKTGIAVDTTEWETAYVIDRQAVYYTTNTGTNWTDITGNLPTTDLRTIVFIPGTPASIAVGGRNGVFRMPVNDLRNWSQFGTGLPNVPVMELDYDDTDHVLTAATFGRGVWTLGNVGGSSDTAPGAPTGVTTTVTSSRSVQVDWTAPVGGASSYNVYRTDSIGGTYGVVCSSVSTTCTDSLAGDGHVYLYKVRAVSAGGTESTDSNLDLATMVAPLYSPPGLTVIHAEDIISLRSAVQKVRTFAGIGTVTFTDADNTLQNHAIKGIHVQELRDKLEEAWTSLHTQLLTLTVPSSNYSFANVDPAMNGGHHYPVLQDDITKLRKRARMKQ